MAGTYTITRSASIAVPPDAVHAVVADLRRWQEWSPWEGLDENLQRSYSGSDSGVGAVYEWSGNRQAGVGRMEVVESEPGSHVRIDLQFLKPFKATNDVVFEMSADGDGSTVTWTMHGASTLMWRIMDRVMRMSASIADDFDKGLSQMKAALEG